VEITRVTVVGAGAMGSGITQVLAEAGIVVTLTDTNSDALAGALATIERALSRAVERGRISEDDKGLTLSLIDTDTTLDSVRGAHLVIEAVTEDFDLKKELFKDLDGLSPERTILASNTSSISITALAAHTRRPGQVVGMHFFNPVPAMQLVEVVRGLTTTSKTVEAIQQLAGRIGKTPVEVNDYPGFVSNRVLLPMINEAVFCLMEGVGSRDNIDAVMKLGMAHPMGPLALADLIGLDICLDVLEVLQHELGDPKYRPCPLLRQMVYAGKLGRKTGEGFYTYPDTAA
jgi:3-hydroxybutyryl-CoA dehydrogenase